jgi:hypothetical protein
MQPGKQTSTQIIHVNSGSTAKQRRTQKFRLIGVEQ